MALPQKSPDTLKRAVIWQPSTGNAWDASGGDVLKDWFITPQSEYFNGGDGSQHEISRSVQAAFSVIIEDLATGIKIIRRQACPVRAVFFGFVKHTLWLEKTRMNTLPQRGGTGLLATERIVLSRRATYPHIYDAQNIIADFPWHCASAVALYGDSENPEVVTGYRLHGGNPSTELGWESTGTNIPTVGMDGILGGDEVVLEFEFPVPNCTLRFFSGSGRLEVLAHPDSGVTVIDTVLNNQTTTLPSHAWSLRITVPKGDALPTLVVEDVGQPVGYRYGVCNVCEGLALPPWAELTSEIDIANLVPGEDTSEIDITNLVPGTAPTDSDIEAANLGYSLDPTLTDSEPANLTPS